MTAIEVLDEERLRKPAGFDLDTYMRSGALGFGEGNAISLEVLFDAPAADHLYETPLADDQRLTVEPDGRVRVRATVRDTPQLSWWLLGFGAQVEVRKPKSLRTSMAETARAMAAVYRA